MPEYVTLEPNYEQTTIFLAEAICQGAHEQPYLAMYSVLDQMRFLDQTDPAAARRVMEHFNTKHLSWEMPEAYDAPEDEHLEADYEDRGGYPDLDGVGNFDYSPELDG